MLLGTDDNAGRGNSDHLARRTFLRSAVTAGLGAIGAWAPAAARSQRLDAASEGGPDAFRRATLFLAGDVMTGRGIDQVLPHPSDPVLFEPYVRSALTYVGLAEGVHGPNPRPVDFAYVWGDALAELEARRPAVRAINLETAVTSHADPEPKGINYRMSPANVPVLHAAGVDCCVLANNHVLDWKAPGLIETLATLERAGLKTAGAGHDHGEAAAPAVLRVGNGARVLVFAFGSPTSGIPPDWAAAEARPGVNLLPDLSGTTIRPIAEQVARVKRSGDIVVASIHWGSNWGYTVPKRQVSFAHGLIDEADVDLVHGHSSHHPRGIEVYRGRLILYGCGDFLNDYEGIGGQEAYRPDLILMYLPSVRTTDGTLAGLTMVPFQIRNFRLNRASAKNAEWLRDTLDREGRSFGTSVHLEAENTLRLAWE